MTKTASILKMMNGRCFYSLSCMCEQTPSAQPILIGLRIVSVKVLNRYEQLKKRRTPSSVDVDRVYKDYAREVNREMIPTTINIGKARDINPPTTIKMRLMGKSTMVKMNFEIPQAALMPKNNNLPNTNNINIENNNVNISFIPSAKHACSAFFV